ncbi:MAG: ASKHA domain-containing protein [Armatimonadota bacterium]
MPKHQITFLPDDRSTTIEEHQTLLEAAAQVGVYINQVCSGEGVCGRCRVVVRAGDVSTEPSAHLGSDEMQAGYALACLAYPKSDVTVEVPLESRLEGGPKSDRDTSRFSAHQVLMDEPERFPHDPLSQKRFLDMPEPTLEDSASDMDRVFREIQREENIPNLQIGLAPLRRLSAQIRDNDWQLTATLGRRGGTVEVVQVEGGDTSAHNYGVAVDIGTTTVVAHLVDLINNRTLGQQAAYNAQIQFGEDIISRIMYGRTADGLGRLTSAVVTDINNLIAGLVETAGINLHDITCVLCAGNTTMTHLLLGLDPANIRLEPYVPLAATPPVIRAAEAGIGINPRGLLACVPSIACYVGGDVVAGTLVSGLARSEEPSLLIDVGTNAEIVVGNQDWSVCCAASAGPTFEGGGISCGMRATRGAIERFNIGKGGRISYSVVGGGKPIGLCGSGLIDTVASLLRSGCLERSGLLVHDGDRVREGDDGPEFVLVDADQTANGKALTITQADIQNFIRSKGAIYHASECLLNSVGLTFADLTNVYISGGFGNYLDIAKAITIGMLPDLPLEHFQFIGNGSVQGAKMMLLSREAQQAMEIIASRMTYIELSTDPKFMNEYTSALFLPHTDIERFPSVRLELAKR